MTSLNQHRWFCGRRQEQLTGEMRMKLTALEGRLEGYTSSHDDVQLKVRRVLCEDLCAFFCLLCLSAVWPATLRPLKPCKTAFHKTNLSAGRILQA